MEKVTAGINPNVHLSHFPEDEYSIVQKFGKDQYVTNGGKEFELNASSKYRYFLFKPVDYFSKQFNLEYEIIVLFSPYENFEPRTLDAYDRILSFHEEFRLEKICSVLISKDKKIEDKIRGITSSNPESPNIIPFHYEEILNWVDPHFVRNRFRDFLYTRDLFDFSGPLKKDLFFYGRNEIINDVLNRHKSNENFGIFGLRRTGKTSIVYGVKRSINKVDSIAAIIDCQNTSFSQRRWYKALFIIIYEIINQNNIFINLHKEEDYTIENCSICFEDDLKCIFQVLKKRILIIFDEIERVTFSISETEHWKNNKDFIFFWQTIRSIYQKNDFFSFLITGTNPKCIETSMINNMDNPIFNQITHVFVSGFTISQTREMVRKLGRVMGIDWKEEIYTKLTEDYGGHPFLIRQFCSLINKTYTDRPYTIDKASYEKIKKEFSERTEYIEMIINVLKEQYKDEYDMLMYLALDDLDTFKYFASEAPEMVRHLIGYGIVEKINNNYNFRIDSVKNYLVNAFKYKKILKTQEERVKEISERRNKIELTLRKIIRQQLIVEYGKTKSKEIIVDSLKENDKRKATTLGYSDLFDPRQNNIYFSSLIKIIEENYNCFQNIFCKNKNDIILTLNNINIQRIDAHASDLTETEFNYLRACLEMIEKLLIDFEE